MTKNKLLFGWGVNDVDYNVTKTAFIGGKWKIIWICPYYKKWVKILERCFCPKYHEKQPTYKGCTVHEEWKYLSNFIRWVDSQPNRNWINCEPDKDILVEGNKHYSPDTVVFVSKKVNNFIKDLLKSRGKYMIGVSDSGSKNKPYISNCRNPFTGKGDRLGLYTTEMEAHLAWQSRKHELACMLADEQVDERVAKILRERYAPDKDWTKA